MESIFQYSLVYTIIMTAVSIISCTILYYKYVHGYWSRRCIPFIKPQIPFGNMKKYLLQQESVGEIVCDLYNELKTTGRPFAGMFVLWEPVLLILDPEIVKLVTMKEFEHFSARQQSSYVKNDPLSGHLLNLDGDEWKFMRSNLTPIFSSGKIKMMFEIIVSHSKHLEIILDEYSKTNEPLEIKDIMARYTTDIIGSCAFGIDCNSLKDPDNGFRKQGKKIFEITALHTLKLLFTTYAPEFSYMVGIRRILKETTTFFMNLVKDTIEYRRKNNVNRNDFLNLLTEIKFSKEIGGCNHTEDEKLTLEQIAAQSFLFFSAGFATSSSASSSVIYELCLHPEVQDKVRHEINQVLKENNNKLTYHAITKMKYLEQVIDETMRLHAVVPIIARKCVRDYKFPNSNYTIKTGTIVFISVKGFHENPEYYPNPKIFDPDRFSAEEKTKRHSYVYLPFGAGPRKCIGIRFGMLQMKVGLVALLKDYKFTLNSRTQTPLKRKPKYEQILSYIGGIWIDVNKVK